MGQRVIVLKKIGRRRTYVAFSIYLLIVLMSLFVTASYTWFTLSRAPRVSNMNVYVTTVQGLELSADPGPDNWTQHLSFDETTTWNEKNQLWPVTWCDNAWSESGSEDVFRAAAYGYDGRLLDYPYWQPLSDDTNNYYIKSTYYARSGQAVDVCLLPEDKRETGSGNYVIGNQWWDWSTMGHIDRGRGIERAIRVGFRMTYVDSAGNPLSQRTPMFILEPNSDRHVDGSDGYVPTYSLLNGIDPLVPYERMLQQGTSKWVDMQPPSEGQVIINPADFIDRNGNKLARSPILFSLKPSDIMRIEMYVWLEGQDVDCVSIIAKAGTDILDPVQIEEFEKLVVDANIQFYGASEGQSGMVIIE